MTTENDSPRPQEVHVGDTAERDKHQYQAKGAMTIFNLLSEGGGQGPASRPRPAETRFDDLLSLEKALGDKVIAPPGLAGRVDSIKSGHLAIVTAQPHQGRRTALGWLTLELAARIRRDETEPTLSHLTATAETRLHDHLHLLEAGTIIVVDTVGDDAASTSILGQLKDCLNQLRTKQVYLLAVVADRLSEHAASATPDAVIPLERPSEEAVFGRWITDSPHRELAWKVFLDPSLTDARNTAWPPRVASLAIHLDRQIGAGVTDPARLLQGAKALLFKQPLELTSPKIAKLGPWPRAILTASAFLESASSAAKIAAATALLDLADPDHRPPSVMVESGLEAKFKDLSEVFDCRSLRFRQIGGARATLRLIWDDYPRMRPAIRDWIVLVSPESARLEADDFEGMAARVAELARETDFPKLLTDPARKLITDDPEELLKFNGAGRLPVDLLRAVRLVRLAAFDPLIGQPVRRTLADWANERDTPVLPLVLLHVCGDDEFLERHPDSAFAVLNRVMSHQLPFIQQQARATILHAADRLRLDVVLHGLAGWVQWNQAIPHELHELIEKMLERGPVQETLRTRDPLVHRKIRRMAWLLWRAVLVHGNSTEIADITARWVAALSNARTPLSGDLALSILAADGDLQLTGKLLQSLHLVQRRLKLHAEVHAEISDLIDRLSEEPIAWTT
ncbi:hypothetical protein [Glycomyces buryatensis]|uniref:Uncharacterized protein n=1 Tax=Glycomyces buryatensis TaxID=2570927 RepID=A0A4S8QKJ9_9ACTN|nr:hypothetical protein [Glycomyces buryatensis]THV41959.1 hypothetical protein FAB82_08480 [Glycomyces buryatensis]